MEDEQPFLIIAVHQLVGGSSWSTMSLFNFELQEKHLPVEQPKFHEC